MTHTRLPQIPKIQICIPTENVDAIKRTQQFFENYTHFSVRVGPITATNCTTVLTDSNSLGFFVSQTDKLIQRDVVDFTRNAPADFLEHKIRQRLKIDYNYELPIGNTLLVRTEHPQLKCLIFTPIRYAAEDISATANIYHAFRSALSKARQLLEPEIATPLLGVSAGLSVEESCRQMLEAYMSVYEQEIKGDRPRTLEEAHIRLLKALPAQKKDVY
jgi:hypothetical protein